MISDDRKNAPASFHQTSEQSRSKTQDPALDRAIQARIGDRLRAMYDTLADEPVPDRLASILAQLGTKGGDTGR